MDLLNEINDLKRRAILVGYKNKIPKLPDETSNFDQSMIGFNYRLHNWKNQLLQLENPGGLPHYKNIITESKDLDLRHYVINKSDLAELHDDVSDDHINF